MDSIENFNHSWNDFISHYYSVNNGIYRLKPITVENETNPNEVMEQIVSNGLNLMKTIRNKNTTHHPSEIIETIVSSILKCHHYVSDDSLNLVMQTTEVTITSS